MDMIPLFKPINLETLTLEYGVTLGGPAKWVGLEVPYDVANELDDNYTADEYDDVDSPLEYESNRYDLTIYDPALDQPVTVYAYFSESLETIYAIDDIAEATRDKNTRVETSDTIFDAIIEEILLEHVI